MEFSALFQVAKIYAEPKLNDRRQKHRSGEKQTYWQELDWETHRLALEA